MTNNATTLKRFFKKHFNIPVRVETGKSQNPYIVARIPPQPCHSYKDPLTYNHDFPPELGNKCMRIIYRSSESLCRQSWGGNIDSHSIAMHGHEWDKLIALYEEQPCLLPSI